jgi:hypothetical protein
MEFFKCKFTRLTGEVNARLADNCNVYLCEDAIKTMKNLYNNTPPPKPLSRDENKNVIEASFIDIDPNRAVMFEKAIVDVTSEMFEDNPSVARVTKSSKQKSSILTNRKKTASLADGVVRQSPRLLKRNDRKSAALQGQNENEKSNVDSAMIAKKKPRAKQRQSSRLHKEKKNDKSTLDSPTSAEQVTQKCQSSHLQAQKAKDNPTVDSRTIAEHVTHAKILLSDEDQSITWAEVVVADEASIDSKEETVSEISEEEYVPSEDDSDLDKKPKAKKQKNNAAM